MFYRVFRLHGHLYSMCAPARVEDRGRPITALYTEGLLLGAASFPQPLDLLFHLNFWGQITLR